MAKQQDKNLIHLIDLMPQDSLSQHILAKRAQHLAMPVSDLQDQKQGINYVRFKLGGSELYGIPYHYIKEIIMYSPPTKVPYTAGCIAGIINRHGVLISVLDLSHYFHLKHAPDASGSQFIVVSAKGVTIAILVQTVDGNDAFDSTTLMPPLQFQGAIKADYIQGIHLGTIAVINVEALIADLQKNTMHIKESIS